MVYLLRCVFEAKIERNFRNLDFLSTSEKFLSFCTYSLSLGLFNSNNKQIVCINQKLSLHLMELNKRDSKFKMKGKRAPTFNQLEQNLLSAHVMNVSHIFAVCAVCFGMA